jgi:hypothetical protein
LGADEVVKTIVETTDAADLRLSADRCELLRR